MRPRPLRASTLARVLRETVTAVTLEPAPHGGPQVATVIAELPLEIGFFAIWRRRSGFSGSIYRLNIGDKLRLIPGHCDPTGLIDPRLLRKSGRRQWSRYGYRKDKRGAQAPGNHLILSKSQQNIISAEVKVTVNSITAALSPASCDRRALARHENAGGSERWRP